MTSSDPAGKPLIGLVGACKSGKSLLKANLARRGYPARHIAQEHSFAPRMWQQIAQPDVLVFMEVSFADTLARGQRWQEADYQEQLRRLAHARAHADLVVNTSQNSPEQILAQVIAFLAERS